MMKWLRKQKTPIQKQEKGQSLVELAISMVILLILLAGIVDLGRAIIMRFIIQDAAEEGIVYGTSFPTDCAQIEARIRDNIPNSIQESTTFTMEIKIYPDDISCYSIPYANVYAGKILRITIDYNFPISMPFLATFTGSQIIPLTITTNGYILRPPDPND